MKPKQFLAAEHTETPRRQKKYCFLFYWRFVSQGLSCRRFFSRTQRGLDWALPEVIFFFFFFFFRLLHIAFSIAAVSLVAAEGAARSGNREALTEFNKGAGLNQEVRGWSGGPPQCVGEVRKDPEGPGGWLSARLWSAAGNRHCQCTGHLKTGDTVSWG